MEEKLDQFIDVVNDKLNKFEQKLTEGLQGVHSSPVGEIPEELSPDYRSFAPTRGCHVAAAPGTGFTTAAGTFEVPTDIQGEFSSLKDSLSRVRLPAERKLNESRQGVRRSDQPVLNILTKCSRYSETTAKLLSTIAPGQTVSQETLDKLFLICHAQCKYLQDEYAAVLVNSQFDNSTSRLFQALQKNTSGLNAESLETLRSAATLAAASRPQRGGYSSTQPARGRGRGFFQRSGDVFSGFVRQGFPQNRRDDNSSSAAAGSKDD